MRVGLCLSNSIPGWCYKDLPLALAEELSEVKDLWVLGNPGRFKKVVRFLPHEKSCRFGLGYCATSVATFIPFREAFPEDQDCD
jgi:hypothetical protein